MGSKQVRVDDDVYAKLEDKKRDDESFSDAIDRLTSDWSLTAWGGWMNEETAIRHRERLDDLEAVEQQETDDLLDRLGVGGE